MFNKEQSEVAKTTISYRIKIILFQSIYLA
jgi:hypothetical protein